MIPITVNGYKTEWDENKPLLTKGSSNLKTLKSDKYKDGIYSTMLLHLAPSKISGYNVCPKSSEGCRKICLNMAGQGGCVIAGKLHTLHLHVARSGRTTLLKTNKSLFFKKMKNEIDGFLIKCEIKGSIPCIRLNGTSDLNWAKIKDPKTNKNLMDLYPEIQFYDYTKDINQLKNAPKNYNFTFSHSENNYNDVLKAIALGFNIAVPFDKKIGLPEIYFGLPVFNADETDLRFLDNELAKIKTPIISGLLEKGYLALRDKTGFIVRDHKDEMKAVA
jgi:hypothetical protein